MQRRIRVLSLALAVLFTLSFVPVTAVFAYESMEWTAGNSGDVVSNDQGVIYHDGSSNGLNYTFGDGNTVNDQINYIIDHGSYQGDPEAVRQGLANGDKAIILDANTLEFGNTFSTRNSLTDKGISQIVEACGGDTAFANAVIEFIEDKMANDPNFDWVLITETMIEQHLTEKYGEEEAKKKMEELKKEKNKPRNPGGACPARAIIHTVSGSPVGSGCAGITYPPGPWRTVGQVQGESVTGVYSTKLTLTPVVPVDFATLTDKEKTEWRRTHHPQNTPVRITEFGEKAKMYDEQGTFNRIREMDNDAVVEKLSADMISELKVLSQKDYTDGWIRLTDANATGLARGGVFTSSRYIKYVTVTFFHNMRERAHFKCVPVQVGTSYEFGGSWTREVCDQYGEDEDGNHICVRPRTEHHCKQIAHPVMGPSKVHSHTEGPVKDPAASRITLKFSDWVVDKSHQVIGVRCNTTKILDLVSKIGGEVFQRSGYVVTAKSPTISGKEADFFNNLDVSFFYKGRECDENISCETAPAAAAARSDGKNNVQNRNTKDGTFGAQSDNTSADHFSYFRDNQENKIRVDIPAPVPEVDAQYWTDPEKVEQTVITRDLEGTPDDDDSKFLDLTTGNDIFRRNEERAIFEGEKNKFISKSQYASEKDKPQRFTFRYDYMPGITSIVPYGISGGGVEEFKPILENIYVKCEVYFNNTTVRKPIVHNDVEDVLHKDGVFNPQFGSTHLEIDYVKSGAEE